MKKICITLMILLLCVTGVQAANLPGSYDLRNVNGKNYVTPVKLQNPWGTCWSFAAISATETSSLLKGANYGSVDLSERSLAWFNSRTQKLKNAPDSTYEGYFTLSTEDIEEGVGIQTAAAFDNGGNCYYSINQFSTWLGSNTEANVPYQNNEGNYNVSSLGTVYTKQGDWTVPISEFYTDTVHLNNGFEISSTPYPDNSGLVNYNPKSFTPQVKENILDYGSGLLLYFPGSGQWGTIDLNNETFGYYSTSPADERSGHLVSIVGWDDDFSASNFNTEPPGDGAWIIKNSWGTNWGDDGYFYMSYYDNSIYSVAFLDAETIYNDYSYDKNYQYDLLGGKFHDPFESENVDAFISNVRNHGLKPGDLQFANVFQTETKETLQAISAYSPLGTFYNTEVSAKVYVLDANKISEVTDPTDGKLVAEVGPITYDYAGFYTIPLDNPVKLSKNQVFSVVEEMTISNGKVSIPYVSCEYGAKDVILEELQDPNGTIIGSSLSDVIAVASPHQSFVYGLDNSDNWSDMIDLENDPVLSFKFETEVGDNYTEPGNCMIKAFTTYDDNNYKPSPGRPELDSIKFTPSVEYLSTLEGNTSTFTTKAEFYPENAYVDIQNLGFSVIPETVAKIDRVDGNTVTVSAVSEGIAVLLCSNGGQALGTATIVVSNNPIVYDGIETFSDDPEFFNIRARNVQPNPAYSEPVELEKVSIFSWSEENQSDINAKIATQEPGSNNYVISDIPINGKDLNNYFINADDINIHVYASTPTQDCYLGMSSYNWRDAMLSNELLVYTPYAQNLAFLPLEVNNAGPVGVLDNPDSDHLEGFRISSGFDGIYIDTTVYSQGLGWLPTVGDGTYAGTMWQNRPIQAIKLQFEPSPALAGVHLNYRVYLKDYGWTAWAADGEECGSTTDGIIQAIELKLGA